MGAGVIPVLPLKKADFACMSCVLQSLAVVVATVTACDDPGISEFKFSLEAGRRLHVHYLH